MDTRSGKIVSQEMVDSMDEENRKAMVAIAEGDMTKLQKTQMRVSLHDHRSILGEQLTAERRKRGMTKNQLRKLRRKGKLR